MDKKTIYAMKNAFDEIVKIIQEEAVEFWYARDLMALLGYDRWENFHKAIERAIDSCKASEIEPADHFRSVTKMVQIGSGAERAVKDYMLTRYACYLRSSGNSKYIYRCFYYYVWSNIIGYDSRYVTKYRSRKTGDSISGKTTWTYIQRIDRYRNVCRSCYFFW